jgi:uncharacterized protein (UPF0333 family)
MKKNLKAQAAVEFLILLGVLSVVFAISVNYYIGYSLRSDGFIQEQTYQLLCSQISNEIDKALLFGPRYERDFYLPAGNYSVKIENYETKITYFRGQVVCYNRANITKDLTIGKNTIIYDGTDVYVI